MLVLFKADFVLTSGVVAKAGTVRCIPDEEGYRAIGAGAGHPGIRGKATADGIPVRFGGPCRRGDAIDFPEYDYAKFTGDSRLEPIIDVVLTQNMTNAFGRQAVKVGDVLSLPLTSAANAVGRCQARWVDESVGAIS